MHSWLRALMQLAVVFGVASVACAQTTSPKKFIHHATIQRTGNTATLFASSPRPLMQAVSAVNDEYGWAVNYEDPPYDSAYDLIEIASPAWRASHPDIRPLRIPSGGLFGHCSTIQMPRFTA